MMRRPDASRATCVHACHLRSWKQHPSTAVRCRAARGLLQRSRPRVPGHAVGALDDGVMEPVDGRPPLGIGEHSTGAAAVRARGISGIIGTIPVPHTVTVLDAVELQPVTT